MSGVILGTAGHIDHGKTSLVRALTGVDTDRLRQEKERGITIELGFAALEAEGGHRFGVVDVPGHEAFVRAMVAGAAGMDVVLLVVASDEGVMPQTREHLAIVELLEVPELVVALTKCDLVEEEWLDLVHADVEALLGGTRYEGAPRVPTSAADGHGLEALVAALVSAAGRVVTPQVDDLARLPLDRVFTIQGTGTVVTGTLWSGSLEVSDRVRILPAGLEARIRAIQVHDRDVSGAGAGDRAAVALVGDGANRTVVARGATLVTAPVWPVTSMLTARARLLRDTDWGLEHNQRVHLHHGTAEVLARCVVLEEEGLRPGDSGWIQLRLEEPLAARAGDPFVIRAYSPVTTIGGGVIAEVTPPKRKSLDARTRALLEFIVDGDVPERLRAYVELAGWAGGEVAALPVHVGASPDAVERALVASERDALHRSPHRVFGPTVWGEARSRLLAAVEEAHRAEPWNEAVSLASVRAALPKWASPELAGAALVALEADGALEPGSGGVRLPDHRPSLTEDQEAVSARLEEIFRATGLGAPPVDELPEALRTRSDVRALVRRLETLGFVRQIADGLYVEREALDAGVARVVELLGGRSDLGPADFKEALPVSRKSLIPLLNYLDGQGTTVRRGGGRDVPERASD